MFNSNWTASNRKTKKKTSRLSGKETLRLKNNTKIKHHCKGMVFQKPCWWNLWSYTTWKAKGGSLLWSTSPLYPQLHYLASPIFKIAPPCDWSGTCPHGVVARQVNISKRVKLNDAKCRYCIPSHLRLRGTKKAKDVLLNWSKLVLMFHLWKMKPIQPCCSAAWKMWYTHIELTLSPVMTLPLRRFLVIAITAFYVWHVFMVHQSTSWNSHAQGVTSFEAALFQFNFESQMHCKMQQIV